MSAKYKPFDHIVHPQFVPGWVGMAGFVSGILALIGALGVVAGGILMLVAFSTDPGTTFSPKPPPVLSAMGATYLIGMSLSIFALASIVDNLAACRLHLLELVTLKAVEQGVPPNVEPDVQTYVGPSTGA